MQGREGYEAPRKVIDLHVPGRRHAGMPKMTGLNSVKEDMRSVGLVERHLQQRKVENAVKPNSLGEKDSYRKK